jgi:hypothetical protein
MVSLSTFDILVDSSDSTNRHTPSHTDILGAVSKNQSAAAVQPVLPTVAMTNGSPTPVVEHIDDWDTEDTASMSDTASISSGCSSVGSQGKSAVVWLCVLKMRSFVGTVTYRHFTVVAYE